MKYVLQDIPKQRSLTIEGLKVMAEVLSLDGSKFNPGKMKKEQLVHALIDHVGGDDDMWNQEMKLAMDRQPLKKKKVIGSALDEVILAEMDLEDQREFQEVAEEAEYKQKEEWHLIGQKLKGDQDVKKKGRPKAASKKKAAKAKPKPDPRFKSKARPKPKAKRKGVDMEKSEPGTNSDNELMADGAHPEALENVTPDSPPLVPQIGLRVEADAGDNDIDIGDVIPESPPQFDVPEVHQPLEEALEAEVDPQSPQPLESLAPVAAHEEVPAADLLNGNAQQPLVAVVPPDVLEAPPPLEHGGRRLKLMMRLSPGFGDTSMYGRIVNAQFVIQCVANKIWMKDLEVAGIHQLGSCG